MCNILDMLFRINYYTEITYLNKSIKPNRWIVTLRSFYNTYSRCCFAWFYLTSIVLELSFCFVFDSVKQVLCILSCHSVFNKPEQLN